MGNFDLNHFLYALPRISIEAAQGIGMPAVPIASDLISTIFSISDKENIMKTETLKVTGMTSEDSTAAVIRALTSIGGVQNVKVSYANENAVVEFDEQRTATPELVTALAKAGFSLDIQKELKKAQGGCCGGCCS